MVVGTPRRSGGAKWSIGAWILVITAGVVSVAAGFGAGTWWQGRDTAPARALWVLAQSADAAQLTPASGGLFTLSMSPSDPEVLAVRKDAGGDSALIPLLRLESEWRDMYGDASVPITLLIHDAPADGDPDSTETDRIELLSAAPVVDGDMVTYPVEVIRPSVIAEDGVLRAFTKVTLLLPEAERTID
ncbi:MAG: hypothetical protein ACO3YU_01200 [Candidatus Nanopelagicales bacterium]|jgi:hypothetical protein